MAHPDCSQSRSLGWPGDDGAPLRLLGQWSGPHLAQGPGGALGAVAAEAVHQVLAEATMAGAAGTRVQLQLTVPATEAPRAHTLVAGRQVLAEGKERPGREPQSPPAPGGSSHVCAGAGQLHLTLQVPPC